MGLQTVVSLTLSSLPPCLLTRLLHTASNGSIQHKPAFIYILSPPSQYVNTIGTIWQLFRFNTEKRSGCCARPKWTPSRIICTQAVFTDDVVACPCSNILHAITFHKEGLDPSLLLSRRVYTMLKIKKKFSFIKWDLICCAQPVGCIWVFRAVSPLCCWPILLPYSGLIVLIYPLLVLLYQRPAGL